MSYVPWSSAARGAASGVTASGVALWDDASASAQLDTLGAGAEGKLIFADASAGDILTELDVSAFVQTALNDADAPTFRTTIGAGVGLAVETKAADFTAADAKLYEMDSSGGAIVATLPDCSANALIGFKLKTAGNNVTLTRAGTDTIDGATTLVMSVTGEYFELYGNAAGDIWLVR